MPSPYVPNSHKKQIKTNQPASSSSFSNAYGAPASTASSSTYGSSASPYNPYGNSQPTTVPASNSNATTTGTPPYNPYANQASFTLAETTTPQASSTYNPYETATVSSASTSTSESTLPSSSFNPYNSQQSSQTTTIIANRAETTSNMPDFYHAPDASVRTAPIEPVESAFGKATITSNSAVAVATAVPGAMLASTPNSSTYTGGPTGGIVSEGNPTHSHKIDYEIKGHDMQLVEVELDPSETVIAEAGGMMFLEEGIDFKTKFGDGSEPKQGFFKKLVSAGGRLLTGESLFVTHFTNQGQTKARVAFAAPYPGTIIPVNLMHTGGSIICQKDAFLCAAFGTKLAIHFNKKIGSGLFGGEGFILQKLSGDGLAFIHTGGTIIKRELRGEKIRLDTGCLVAFTEGVNFSIELVKGFKSMIFGGEGLFLATLQGTGTVWLQSLPFSRMADRILLATRQRQGEGSALTGRVGDLIGGDGGGGFGGGIGRF